ncbi:SDR family NAD(P)-dependent oxidoreductase, partial [Leptospira sp. SA-E8]|uniref:SDR family NAD(P)-dependent oxidoreductase n=1 Tax=Leptospira sp. SA-E8 TaxID=3422259 RepID=UPI003EBD193D
MAQDSAYDVAIVTGAAQGLGEAIARRLHAAGYKVAVADLALDKAEGVARSLDATGATALALQLDIRNKADFEAARDALVARWGG